jgi:ATP-dependent DNA ligase
VEPLAESAGGLRTRVKRFRKIDGTICGRRRSGTARRCYCSVRAESWIALTNGIVGEGRALYRAVVDADLEGIVARHLADTYHPKLARWHKILNRPYSQAVRPRGIVPAPRTPKMALKASKHIS